MEGFRGRLQQLLTALPVSFGHAASVACACNAARAAAEAKHRRSGVHNSMQCKQIPLPHCLAHLQGAPTPPAGTFDDADDAADWVSSLLDAQLESVDDALAEARRAAEQPAGEGASAAAAAAAAGGAAIQQQPAGRKGRSSAGFTSYMDAAAQLAPRPQEQFADPVDNSRTRFAHKLDSLAGVIDVEAAAAEAAAAAAAGAPRPHPLAARLQALAYPAWQLEVGEAVPPKSNEETPFTYIDSVPALRAAGALGVGLPVFATLCGQWVQGGMYCGQGMRRLLQERPLCAPADAATAGRRPPALRAPPVRC